MSNLFVDLNSQQYAAVTLPNEPALILAGAGSGKTRVLITRIAWLIQNNYASPKTILSVTFTNKSAREMLHRLSDILLIDTCEMWIGTFHGLCNRMLRVHYRDADLPQFFQILDTSDQLSAIKRLIKTLNIDSEKYSSKNVQYFINSAKERGLRQDNIETTDSFNQKLVEVYQEYENQCKREGVIDFPELILRCNELLAQNSLIRTHYQSRFKHILVDEFQDTNKLQYTWLKMLSSKKSSIFAVGDDDQSIYAFRGANVGNMRDFEREFKIRNLIKLEQNYRSNGNIIDAANYLISHNSNRFCKNLSTNADRGEPVLVYQSDTDYEEAVWVADEISSLINTGIPRREIAVLYRSNTQSRSIEHALGSVGISYRVYGGLRFFDRQEVKHVLSYLWLIDNPRNNTAFVRVVNFPMRGIGSHSIKQLEDAAKKHDITMIEAIPYLTGRARVNLSAFSSLIDKMRDDTEKMNLPDTVKYIIRTSGIKKFYESEKEGKNRLENLQELVNSATVFLIEEGYSLNTAARSVQLHLDKKLVAETIPIKYSDDISVNTDLFKDLDQVYSNNTITPLSCFLSLITLGSGDNQEDKSEQDEVQLMTVHAAKGLEFSAVFITGLEEKLFPHENNLIREDGLEEERRLMYVAITRAKNRLYLSFSKSRMLHGQIRYNMRSRFFDELPNQVIKWLRTKAEKQYLNTSHSNTRLDLKYKETIEISDSLFKKKRYSDLNNSDPRIGQKIFHKKFGKGTVIGLKGNNTDKKIKIEFNLYGEKWLSLALANLQYIKQP
ncbi:MAG: UvrD-helicase domain-containing protein [Burkholderia sp.]|nr:UvrD-helicase domain-containing protein [Burkholderia sp.]